MPLPFTLPFIPKIWIFRVGKLSGTEQSESPKAVYLQCRGGIREAARQQSRLCKIDQQLSRLRALDSSDQLFSARS